MKSNDGMKPAGWFSRLHPTNVEHVAAREAYQAARGRKARQRRAKERLAAAS